MVVRVNTSLVSLLQIVANVEELGIIEVVAKVSIFAIGSCKTRKPIIGHENAWFDLVDAAVLKTCLVEDGNLEYYVPSSVALIWGWEYVAVVQEYNSHASLIALMHRNLDSLILNLDLEACLVSDASRVARKVTCLSLSIPLVVRGDDSNLLAKLDKPNGQLIDHDTEAANCGPSSELWGREHKLSELVAFGHGVSSSHRWQHSVPSALVADLLRHGQQPRRQLGIRGKLKVVHKHFVKCNIKLVQE